MKGLENGYRELLKSVGKLTNVSTLDVVFLRLKIARILLLSWHDKGNMRRGLTAAIKALSKY